MNELVINPRTNIKIRNYLKNPSHALILTGQSNNGKSELASYISKVILDVPNIDNYPYFHIIKPVDNKLGIEQIRELQNLIKLKIPSKNQISRIIVIHNSDLLGEDAQNALLKTLEEPPIDTMLILLVNDPNSLLQTVKSRAVIIDVQNPTHNQLIEYFTEQGHDKDKIERAILIASNRTKLIYNILQNNGSEVENDIDYAKQILTKYEYDRLTRVNELSKDKEKSQLIIECLILISRSAMKSAKQPEQSKRWHKVLKNTEVAKQRMSKNGNTKIILTDLFLNL